MSVIDKDYVLGSNNANNEFEGKFEGPSIVREKKSLLGSNWGNISSVTSASHKKSAPVDKSCENSNTVEEQQDDDLRISKFLRFSNVSCSTNDIEGNPDDSVHLTTIHENEGDYEDGAEAFDVKDNERTDNKEDFLSILLLHYSSKLNFV